MNVRKTSIGIVVSFAVSLVLSIFLVLFWPQLSLWIQGMNVGFFMFFNINFYYFLAFVLGLTFALTLVIRFAVNEKFKYRE